MMRNFKQIFFVAWLVIGISITGTAQQKEDKKPPKKDPPVIVVTPKKEPKDDKPKEDKPKDGKKPQKIIFNGKYEISFV
jgi:hypothetical protein